MHHPEPGRGFLLCSTGSISKGILKLTDKKVIDVRLAKASNEADKVKAHYLQEASQMIEGWDTLPSQQQDEIADLLRLAMESGDVDLWAAGEGEDGKSGIRPKSGVDELLSHLYATKAFASRSGALVSARLEQLANHADGWRRGNLRSKDLNAMLAMVAGASAEDAVQSALATQMAATHDAAMQMLRRTGASEFSDQMATCGNLAVKLMNAFTRQAEALAKLQRGGEQVVKHIHIDNRGGQAVVTEQLVARGASNGFEGQPHEFGPAMLGQDPAGNGMPIASNEGQEKVQAARRAVDRGAEG